MTDPILFNRSVDIPAFSGLTVRDLISCCECPVKAATRRHKISVLFILLIHIKFDATKLNGLYPKYKENRMNVQEFRLKVNDLRMKVMVATNP
jgi:hypothetical protein